MSRISTILKQAIFESILGESTNYLIYIKERGVEKCKNHHSVGLIGKPQKLKIKT